MALTMVPDAPIIYQEGRHKPDSLFIDPKNQDVKIAKELQADCIELHTGKLCNLINNKKNYLAEFKKINNAVNLASNLNLEVHAGHGLTYKSAKIISKIKKIKELNIGHFIIGEAIFVGLMTVIKKFKKIIN